MYLKVREVGRAGDPPWLNCELPSLLKRELYQRWKSRQTPGEDYEGISRVCRDAVRKAEAQLELKLARGIENYKKNVLQICKQTGAQHTIAWC